MFLCVISSSPHHSQVQAPEDVQGYDKNAYYIIVNNHVVCGTGNYPISITRAKLRCRGKWIKERKSICHRLLGRFVRRTNTECHSIRKWVYLIKRYVKNGWSNSTLEFVITHWQAESLAYDENKLKMLSYKKTEPFLLLPSQNYREERCSKKEIDFWAYYYHSQEEIKHYFTLLTDNRIFFHFQLCRTTLNSIPFLRKVSSVYCVQGMFNTCSLN